MQLFFQKIGDHGPPLLILHGLFGSSDNWLTLARRWSSDYQVYLVDQRNHGRSPHHEQFDYQSMADDVYRLIKAEGLDPIDLIGHSMGGKTAMTLAAMDQQLIKKLIVVDIGPKAYPVHHNAIIAAMESLPINQLNSRREADEALTRDIPELGTRQFILKNLSRRQDGGYDWKVNLPVIKANIEEVGRPQAAEIIVPTLFLRGERSDYIMDGDWANIEQQFPQSELITIPNAGHWIHAEQPQAFYEEVDAFMN